jgi:hypothetical protein
MQNERGERPVHHSAAMQETLARAQDLDNRRQIQIQNQIHSLARLQKQLEIAEEILDDHGLGREFTKALRDAGVS